MGYYFSEVETYIEDLDNNLVNIQYKIDLENKAKLKNYFYCDKKYKDKVLRNNIWRV